MMNTTPNEVDVYVSRGGTMKISRSTQHQELWNVEEVKTRKAHALRTSKEVILQLYPKD